MCLRGWRTVVAYGWTMPSSNRTPGRLPARVYWFRRLLVLGTALALVFAIARVLSGGDAQDVSSRANTVASTPTSLPGGRQAGPQAPVGTAKATATATATGVPAVLAQPDGPCAADEVIVKPVEGTAVAGRAVPVVLQLTATRPACTFAVNAQSLVAKVSTGSGKVWSTQDCPSSVSATTVVVRSAAPISIQVSWSGRKSDSACSRETAWALPATYQVVAAAIGSEPSTASLTLTVPERPIVVRTIQPKPAKKQSTSPTTPDTGH